MPDFESIGNSLTELQQLAVMYNRYEENPQEFLDNVHSRSQDELSEFLDVAKTLITKTVEGVFQISPVVFVRYVLINRILQGETVTLEDISELQNRVDERDIDFFSEYTEYLEPISAQKERTRSAFANWTPFRVLFFIDYWKRSKNVKAHLQDVASVIRNKLDLRNCDKHLAGFEWNQNFGTDRCWIAFFPEDRGNHKQAYQIFLGIYPLNFQYGIGVGHGLEVGEDQVTDVAPNDFSVAAMLDSLKGQVSEFYSLNRAISISTSARGQVSLQKPEAQNLILYGPPGTGKTFTVQRRAVELIDGERVSVSEQSDRFRKYVHERRIELVTFHPSYSYEEFVEGFRYDEEKKIPILHNGVIKRLVKRAINPEQVLYRDNDVQIWKVSLGWPGNDALYDRCISNNEIAIGWYEDEDLTGLLKSDIRDVFTRHGEGNCTNDIRTVDYFVNEMHDGDFVAIRKDDKCIRAIGVVDGEYQYKENYNDHPHVRSVRWVDIRDHDIYELNGSISLTMPAIYRLNRIPFQDFVALLPQQQDDRPFVLIIDEINRGDLSRIFGELVTLLEPDKRKGAMNEMTVRLAYSQEPFSLPQNLHVFGTMNTADRSIALLDVALRRRFEFEELMPDVEFVRSELVAALDAEETEIDLSADQVELICDVFIKLNQRITILLDRDHQLGHSYFMQVRSMADTHKVLYGQVFPLIQEYFYNNREQLIKVLGHYDQNVKSGFIHSLEANYSGAFGDEEVLGNDMPWEFHPYQTGELEDVLRNTF